MEAKLGQIVRAEQEIGEIADVVWPFFIERDSWVLDEGLHFTWPQGQVFLWSNQWPLQEYRKALFDWATKLSWPVRPELVEQTSQCLLYRFGEDNKVHSLEGSQYTRTAYNLVDCFVAPHVMDMSKTSQSVSQTCMPRASLRGRKQNDMNMCHDT